MPCQIKQTNKFKGESKMVTIDDIACALEGHYDDDAIEEILEGLPYELIHILLSELKRLAEMVVATRVEVNALTPQGMGEPYPDIASDILNMSFYDHPAVRRYEELYQLDGVVF
jgi:hypothetical protein